MFNHDLVKQMHGCRQGLIDADWHAKASRYSRRLLGIVEQFQSATVTTRRKCDPSQLTSDGLRAFHTAFGKEGEVDDPARFENRGDGLVHGRAVAPPTPLP